VNGGGGLTDKKARITSRAGTFPGKATEGGGKIGIHKETKIKKKHFKFAPTIGYMKGPKKMGKGEKSWRSVKSHTEKKEKDRSGKGGYKKTLLPGGKITLVR